MGTNYDACLDLTTAGLGKSIRIHIGKSSAGWRFLFRCYYPSDDDKMHPRSIEEWREFIARPDVAIVDEYGEAVDKDVFWERVVSKRSHRHHDGDGDASEIADVLFREFS